MTMSPLDHGRVATWDHGCCALKLVKLATGIFDAEHVLRKAATDQEDFRPSWTIAGTSPTVDDNAAMADLLPGQQQQSSDSKRSRWTRPWREARQRPMLRWKMSASVPPKRTPVTPAGASGEVHLSPKCEVFVQLPMATIPSPMPPEYTTKYFGMVGGELGVMSKAERLGPRPASPELRRVAASSAGTSAAVADHVDDARWEPSPLTSPPDNTNLAKDRPGGTSSARKRRGQLFTAAKPPVTRPIEGPEPPAWSGSRSGLLCDRSDGGGASVVELALAGAEHGGSMELAGARSFRTRLIDSDSSSTTSVTGSGGLRSSQVEGSEGDSSAFALSFVSAPWGVSGDEISEQGPLQTSCHKGSAEAGRAKGAKVIRAVRKTALLKKARNRDQGRRKTRTCGTVSDGHVVELIETGIPKGNVPHRERKGEEGEAGGVGEGHELQQPTDIDKKGTETPSHHEPQPELYDVWIPQHFFKGKGLPTPKRASGESEPQLMPPSGMKTAAGAQHESAANTTAASAPGAATNCGFRQPVNHRREPGEPSVTGKRYAVHYVSGPEGFAKDDAAMSPADRTQPEDTGDEEHAGSERLFVGDNDGGDDQRIDTSGRLPCDDVREDGPGGAGDIGAAILEGAESIAGWRQEEEERIGGQSDDERFDYADRFSWQTAADVVAEAQAEEDARSYDPRSHGRSDGDERLHSFEDGDDPVDARQRAEQYQQERAEAATAAAAAERARARSDHAAAVAVGRLRAPQSVFHPLHRTPSRPEMRRSVTHGRFSPAGRKLWRQSEGLCPRTGQLCLSPRRRSRGGIVVGDGGFLSTGEGPLGVCDWAEVRPPLLDTHREESQWGFSGIGSAVDEGNGSGFGAPSSSGGVPLRERYSVGGAAQGGTEEEDARLPDDYRFDGGSKPRSAEEEEGRGGGVVDAVGAATGTVTGEYGEISAEDQRHGQNFRDDCSGAPVDFCSAGVVEDRSDVGIERAVPTSEDADPPPQSIAKCLSYTVKIPWAG